MNDRIHIRRKFRIDSLFTRILFCLLLMSGLLSLWFVHQFYFQAEANLFREEQGKSDLLMTACAPVFTKYMDDMKPDEARLYANRLMLMENPTIHRPLLDGLEVRNLDGNEIIHEHSRNVEKSFVSESLLFSGKPDRGILGSITLYYSPAYYQWMLRSIRIDLVVAVLIVLAAILITLILLNYFLRPLWYLAGGLEEFSVKDTMTLPPLPGPGSVEIHRVKKAIDLLLESQGNHRMELEQEVRDRTAELKTALISLGESEEKYRNLVERSRDGIIIVQDQIIAYANPCFAELVGGDTDSLAGRPLGDFLRIAPSDGPHAPENEKGSPSIFESIVHRPDGKHFHVELNVGPIHYRNRTADLILIRDVTDRKRLEMELMKKRNLDSLGVLAGGIAHDFNNLLTAVFGNIELAQMQGIGSEKASQLLAEASMAAERAKNLTRQLLTFSKGGNPIKEIASISDIARETCSLVLSGSAVKVLHDIPEDIWPVEVDRGQISQVIHNLLLNAQSAMSGAGLIAISAENHSIEADEILFLKPGRYIRLTVKDNGVGISREDLPRIFDPYFTTRKDGDVRGTGLGLAICHSIVKRHDGHIEVASEVGRGTEFHIYIPATDKTIESAGPPGAPRGDRKLNGGSRKRVLFMDDEESVYQVAESMLDYMGFNATHAANGEKAIQLYEEAAHQGKPYDLVILDLTIRGGMGGERACRRLRELNPSVRAIVTTGYAEDPVVAGFREYGFRSAVTKPFSMGTLGDAIEEALRVETDA